MIVRNRAATQRSDDRTLLALALAKLALHLGTIGLYGFHRDELYLLACGRRLAWGGIDHAPLTPAISRGLELLFGASPAGQRIVAAVAGALLVWTTGLTARRLGGGRTAQLVAAGSVLMAPVFLYTSGVQSTSSVSTLVVVLCLHLAVTIGAGERAAALRWLAIGFLVGLGLLDKYTVLVFAAAIAVAIAATPARRQLRTPWPWLAGAVAVLVWLPNLAWQLRHGAPALEFLREHHAARLREVSLASFFLDQPRLLHPLSFVVAAIGLHASLQRGAPEPRRLAGIAFLVALAILVACRGKPYYLAPAYPALVAAGAVAAEPTLRSWSARARRLLAVVWALGGAVALAGTLPVLPRSIALELGLYRLNPELVQFADWRDLVSQIASALHASTGDAAILTDSYGTAAAIERYGSEWHLPAPLSGANGYSMWSPTNEPEVVLAIGYPPEVLSAAFATVEPIGWMRDRRDLDNRFDFPRRLYWCRGKRAPLGALWPRLRRFD